MTYPKTIIIFALFLTGTLGVSQPIDSTSSSKSINLEKDTASIQSLSENAKSSEYSRHLTNDIIIPSAGAIAICALMLQCDQKIYDNLQELKTKNQIIKDLGPKISYLGDGTVVLGLFGGFVGYGFAYKDKKAIEVGKIGIESFFLSGLTVQVLKYLCGRERPSASTRPGGFWHGPFGFFRQPRGVSKGVASFDAFPSGHTATAFAAATTLSDFYPESWVPYASYSLATLCAISRITESTHWISDCFVGAIIGFYGTRLIEKINYGTTEVTIVPFVDTNRSGLQIAVIL